MRAICPLIFCLLAVLPAAGGYEWRTFADEPDQLSLWHDGRQLGNWRISTREYLPLLAPGTWGDPCPPPYPPPQEVVAPAKIESDGTLNFGLDRARLSGAGKHLLNGREARKEELLSEIVPARSTHARK